MNAIRMTALLLGSCLFVGFGWAGEDKQAKPKQEKPAEAQPANPSRTQDAKPILDIDEFIKKYDTNGDGVLQKSELPALLQRRFSEMDTNKDGKLSREELRQHTEMVQTVVTAIQQRHDRLMSLAATITSIARSDEPGRKVTQTAYDLLRRIDSNNDGKIDSEEWEAARQQLLEWRVNAMMDRQGASRDGKISKEQAHGRLQRHFAAWDTNQDGFIDREELTQALSGNVSTEKTKTKERVKVREKK